MHGFSVKQAWQAPTSLFKKLPLRHNDEGQTAGPDSGNYTEKMMETVQLSTQLVNAILQYLGARPYVEVHQLIAAIQEQAKNWMPPE